MGLDITNLGKIWKGGTKVFSGDWTGFEMFMVELQDYLKIKMHRGHFKDMVKDTDSPMSV